jgi:hypothetical protein
LLNATPSHAVNAFLFVTHNRVLASGTPPGPCVQDDALLSEPAALAYGRARLLAGSRRRGGPVRAAVASCLRVLLCS